MKKIIAKMAKDDKPEDEIIQEDEDSLNTTSNSNKNNGNTKVQNARKTRSRKTGKTPENQNTGIENEILRRSKRSTPHKYVSKSSKNQNEILKKSDKNYEHEKLAQQPLLSETSNDKQSKQSSKRNDQNISNKQTEQILIEQQIGEINKIAETVTTPKSAASLEKEKNKHKRSRSSKPKHDKDKHDDFITESGSESSSDEEDRPYKRRKSKREEDMQDQLDLGLDLLYTPENEMGRRSRGRKSTSRKDRDRYHRKRSRSRSRSKTRSGSRKARKRMTFEAEIESNPKVKELMKQVADMAEQLKEFKKNKNREGELNTPRLSAKKIQPLKSPSEPTIYVPAVRLDQNLINKKDKINNLPDDEDPEVQMINNYIHNIRIGTPQREEETPTPSTSRNDDQPQPSTSGVNNRNRDAREAASEAVIQAEQFKAAIQAPPRGMSDLLSVKLARLMDNDDDEFFHITCHLDSAIKEKIKLGQYVELEKLLQKPEALNYKKQNALQMIYQDGQQVWVPASDRGSKIDSIRKWEQAFRIYAAVYCEANPNRAIEILQYIDTINKAAKRFTWDSVAHYDYIVRHLQASKPHRNWGKTYTQMWNLTLIGSESQKPNFNANGQNTGHIKNDQNKRKTCWRFNKGSCPYGKDCRFKHECSYCGSTNHSYQNCRRKSSGSNKRDRDNGGESTGNGGSSSKKHKSSEN